MNIRTQRAIGRVGVLARFARCGALALALLLAMPLVSTASSASASVSVSMDADRYSALSTLAGAAPVATIRVVDSQGEPIPEAEVRVVFLRILPGVGFAGNETVMTQTGDDGVATATAPQLSTLPGDYMVVVFVAGLSASDRYSIGA